MSYDTSNNDVATEAPVGATVTVRPDRAPFPKLTREEATRLVRLYNPDISTAAVSGEVDNILRESKGDPSVVGDEGTSAGLYQHHLERLTGLKEFAAKEKGDWRDPDLQVRYARMEKERDYPALLKFQQTTDDPTAAEDRFKRIFEKPASVMWTHDASGQPVTGSDRFQFSDYAMREGARRGDLFYMTPQEYLDLSPELEGKPFESPAGRSLLRSFNKGEPIDEVPSLDVSVDGPSAKVTDQDGRHRALLAQQEGVEAMPVSISQTGEGEPKEIEGMSGKSMAFDFPKVEGYQPPKRDQSIGQRIAGMLMPSAEAAELWPGEEPQQQKAESWPGEEAAQPAAAPTQPAAPAEPADSTLMSLAKGASRGFGETVFAGQQLLGKGMEALGIPGGAALSEDARRRIAEQEQQAAADRAAHPIASAVGEIGGEVALPGGLGGLIGRGAGLGWRGLALLQGGLGGLLTPGDPEHFWRDKAIAGMLGAGSGAIAGKISNVLASVAAPTLRPFVKKLMDEGVELTPGMMKGGIAKRLEDQITSIPITGDAITAARQRAYVQFNRAAWNRALEPIGEKMPDNIPMGRAAADYVGDRLSAAYKRILPNVNVSANPADPAFRKFLGDLQSAAADARTMLPDAQFNQFERFVRSQIEQKITNAGGVIDGSTVNGIDSMFGSEVRGYSKSGEHDIRKLGSALGEVQAAFRNLIENQNPAQRDALQATRRGYANYVRVAKAASAAGTATNEGIFSPSQLNQAVRAEDNTTRHLGYARGKALLQDLSDAGQAILPNQYPESGTARRLMLGGGTFGLAELLHHPEILLGLGGAAIPYTPPVSKAVNAAVNKLAQMPAPRLQNALALAARGGGLIGAPAAGAAAGTRFTNIPSITVRPNQQLAPPGPQQ